MKNRVIIYLIFVVFISLFIIMPTLSFFNKTFKSEDNIFTTGEWVPAETSFVLNHKETLNNQGSDYYNKENITSYINESEEHFSIQLEDSKNQFLSFSYRVSSQESAELFDSPSLDVFIGDTKISQVLLETFNNEWHSTSIDLSLLELETGTYNLKFLTNNTYDDLYFPELEIKEVTTKKLFAKTDDHLNFYPNKIVSSLSVEYKIWENNQEVTVKESLLPEYLNFENNNFGYFEFNIPDNFYGTEFSYWSIDLFNNIESTHFVSLELSSNLEISNFEFNYYLESDNELNIQTSYQNLSKTSKYYLAKISQNQITTQNDWDQSTLIQQKQHHQFIDNSLQNSYYLAEENNNLLEVTNNLVFSNMPAIPNYLTLKLCNLHSICESVVENLFIE